MRVLIACEFSGIVRDAFLARGHDAVSCDLLPSEAPGPHIQCDVRDFFPMTIHGFDLLIAHPPCTYLANSGVRWLYTKPGRWDLMREAAEFFRLLLEAPVERVAIENPVIHKHAELRKPDFTIQPWQFGHGETKRICWWTKNLPALEPTNIVEGREARVHKATPSPDRWKERSRFYSGVAEAMAEQWGSV